MASTAPFSCPCSDMTDHISIPFKKRLVQNTDVSTSCSRMTETSFDPRNARICRMLKIRRMPQKSFCRLLINQHQLQEIIIDMIALDNRANSLGIL